MAAAIVPITRLSDLAQWIASGLAGAVVVWNGHCRDSAEEVF